MDNIFLNGLIGCIKKYNTDTEQLEYLKNSIKNNADFSLGFALASENVKASTNMIVAATLYKNDNVDESVLNDDTINLIKELREVNNEENFLLSAMEDVRVTIIKVVEKLLYIQRCRKQMNDSELKVEAENIMNNYVIMADVLGMHDLTVELKDICFKYSHPSLYEQISKAISSNEMNAHKIKYHLSQELFPKLEQYDVAEIRYRLKKPYSIYSKMCENIDVENIPDIYSLTIVLDDSNETVLKEATMKCYSCLGEIHSNYKFRPNSFNDYIACPNYNRYKSLNSTIICYGNQLRIKICTKKMDEINRIGIMKDLYKKNKNEINAELDKYELYKNLKQEYHKMKNNLMEINFVDFYKQLCYLSEKNFVDGMYKDIKKTFESTNENASKNEEIIEAKILKIKH